LRPQGLSLSAGFDRYNRELEVQHSFYFSTSFSGWTFVPKKRNLYLRADLATLGCAISWMTSASVSMADCFVAFLLPLNTHDFTDPGGFVVNLDHAISM
jgi:hypothetical protein